VDPDPDALDQLAADYPKWRTWYTAGKVRGWRVQSTPPVVLRDDTVEGVRARIEEFERVWRETRALEEAVKAAEDLKT
jgi:hypothetical protein